MGHKDCSTTVVSRFILDDLRVNGCHSIYSVTGNDAEERHVDSLLSILLNERHTSYAIIITGPTLFHLLHQTKLGQM